MGTLSIVEFKAKAHDATRVQVTLRATLCTLDLQRVSITGTTLSSFPLWKSYMQ